MELIPKGRLNGCLVEGFDTARQCVYIVKNNKRLAPFKLKIHDFLEPWAESYMSLANFSNNSKKIIDCNFIALAEIENRSDQDKRIQIERISVDRINTEPIFKCLSDIITARRRYDDFIKECDDKQNTDFNSKTSEALRIATGAILVLISIAVLGPKSSFSLGKSEAVRDINIIKEKYDMRVVGDNFVEYIKKIGPNLNEMNVYVTRFLTSVDNTMLNIMIATLPINSKAKEDIDNVITELRSSLRIFKELQNFSDTRKIIDLKEDVRSLIKN